ncbi:MAG: glycosyltransferase [Bacteroidia bacterium]|nr:glycosyltransferase [Bacteroidia bacterium]
MQLREWIFWTSLLLVLYPYGIYPPLIVGLAWIKRRFLPPTQQTPSEWPEVTIVIPAYKEAKAVIPKMESIRRLDYPAEKLRILWVIATHEGDESFSSTMEALQGYPEAEVMIVPHRGKIHSLNEARKAVQTEYALITDADTILSPDSLRQAVLEAVHHPKVGLVGGSRRVLPHQQTVSQNEAYYVLYDERLAWAESTWGCALGVWGGFLLVRKSYWVEMPSGVVDDLYLNLEVNLRGGMTVIAPRAYAYEAGSALMPIEFRRKARIAYTAFHTLHQRFRVSEAFRHPLFLFFFFSHKFCRYLIAPVALLSLLLSTTLLLVWSPLPLYWVIWLFQVGAWVEGFVLLHYPTLKLPKGVGLPGYFVLAHLAQLVGFWKYIRREDPLVVWQRLPRAEMQPY